MDRFNKVSNIGEIDSFFLILPASKISIKALLDIDTKQCVVSVVSIVTFRSYLQVKYRYELYLVSIPAHRHHVLSISRKKSERGRKRKREGKNSALCVL